jgi:hypothetical protein
MKLLFHATKLCYGLRVLANMTNPGAFLTAAIAADGRHDLVLMCANDLDLNAGAADRRHATTVMSPTARTTPTRAYGGFAGPR